MALIQRGQSCSQTGHSSSAWIERTIFTRAESDSIFDVPLAIREAMEAFERRPELAYVVAETAMRGVNGADPSPQRADFDAMLLREVPSLGDKSGGPSSRRCATSTPPRPG